jgi:transcription elongation factor Elf1
MNLLKPTVIHCPYCGESFSILVDLSVAAQQYIEDCQVCCKPIEVRVEVFPDDRFEVEVRNENE